MWIEMSNLLHEAIVCTHVHDGAHPPSLRNRLCWHHHSKENSKGFTATRITLVALENLHKGCLKGVALKPLFRGKAGSIRCLVNDPDPVQEFSLTETRGNPDFSPNPRMNSQDSLV